MTFGKWTEELHYEPEQLRRVERARGIKPEDIIEIDKDKLCGAIYGSQKPRSRERYIYYPSLDSCTCGDFVNRHLPCKHMYRLATECDLLRDDSSHFSEVIGIIENCTDEAQKLAEIILGINVQHDTGNVWVDFSKDHTLITNVSPLISSFEPTSADIILNCPFIKLAPIKLSDCTDRHINELLDKLNKRPTHELKGNDLVDWCEKVVPEVYTFLQNRFMVYIPFYRKTMKMAYRYLVRKFKWDTYSFTTEEKICTVKYPCGARFSQSIMDLFHCQGDTATCYFADDEITKLLTQYGYNRCLNGYKAVAG